MTEKNNEDVLVNQRGRLSKPHLRRSSTSQGTSSKLLRPSALLDGMIYP